MDDATTDSLSRDARAICHSGARNQRAISDASTAVGRRSRAATAWTVVWAHFLFVAPIPRDVSLVLVAITLVLFAASLAPLLALLAARRGGYPLLLARVWLLVTLNLVLFRVSFRVRWTLDDFAMWFAAVVWAVTTHRVFFAREGGVGEPA